MNLQGVITAPLEWESLIAFAYKLRISGPCSRHTEPVSDGRAQEAAFLTPFSSKVWWPLSKKHITAYQSRLVQFLFLYQPSWHLPFILFNLLFPFIVHACEISYFTKFPYGVQFSTVPNILFFFSLPLWIFTKSFLILALSRNDHTSLTVSWIVLVTSFR